MRLYRGIALGVVAFAVYAALGVVPADGATIEGRVIHPTRREAAARIEVFLLGLSRGGKAFEQRTLTDVQGAFSFKDLPGDAAYLVGATYDGVSFPGGSIVFEEGQAQSRSVTFHVYDTTRGPGEATVSGVRWMIEREAGTYRVRQIVSVRNPDMRVVVTDDETTPFFRVALLPNHGKVEMPLGRLPDGTQIRDGMIEIHGPILPGERDLQFVYDLLSEETVLSTSLPVSEDVEELLLLVRDFGVAVDAGPLHPTRPIKDGNELYLRYVGFDVPAGTRIPIRLEPLDPPVEPPGWARALLAAVVAGGLGLLVLAPIERQHRAVVASEPESLDWEREALHSALSDLEFDYETGKLSEEDRDRLREELRREAVVALARVRRPAPKPAAPGACTCGRAPQPGDRFCAACGKAL